MRLLQNTPIRRVRGSFGEASYFRSDRTRTRRSARRRRTLVVLIWEFDRGHPDVFRREQPAIVHRTRRSCTKTTVFSEGAGLGVVLRENRKIAKCILDFALRSPRVTWWL